jgi:Double-GTPase 1
LPDIAMWGAPGTGKTTFLGALDIALSRKDYGITMTGANPASVELLIEWTELINDRHVFPPPTQGIQSFKWNLYTVRARSSTQPPRITLKLTDPSGELMKSAERTNPDRKVMIDEIVDSDGILFMFDPISEFERGDAFSTTNGLLKELMGAYDSNEKITFNGMLPHHVAVCITKFDEPRVLETARTLGILRRDPRDPLGTPWVHDNDARMLFSSLAQVSASGDGEMTLNTLNTHFDPQRIKYFVTSAVGFYVDPRTRKFDFDDPQNLVKDRAGNTTSARIRGPVRPVNIVEPVLWLSERISQSNSQP